MPEKISLNQGPSFVGKNEQRRRLSRLALRLSEPAPVFGTEKNQTERTKSQTEYLERDRRIRNKIGKLGGRMPLLRERPVFYETESHSGASYHFEPSFISLQQSPIIKRLLERPTEFIEQELPVFQRGGFKTSLPRGETIKELLHQPYDISRLKILSVEGKIFLVKRVATGKVNRPLDEFNLAKRASEAGIPTAAPVGYVKDRGNVYIFFEYLDNTLDADSFSVRWFSKSKQRHQLPWINNFVTDTLFSTDSSVAQLEALPDLPLKKTILRMFTIISNITTLFEYCRASRIQYKESDMVCNVFLESLKHDGYAADIKALTGVELPDKMDKNFATLFMEAMERSNVRIERYRAKMNQNMDALMRQAMPDIEKKLWGASVTLPYRQFIEDVMSKMQRAGIRHKDLNLRNILMRMKKDKLQPEPDENGNAQFYLVDWEQI